jgi:5-methylcytosine-specific restriction endonuclease McrA
MTATCTKCGETKPVEEFPRDRTKATGRYPSCSACRRDRMRIYSRKRRKRPLCADCSEPVEPGRSRCAEHLRRNVVAVARYGETHPTSESRREGDRRRTARRRARRHGCDAEPYDRTAIFERDDWTCWLCGEAIVPALAWPNPRSPSIDHVIPLVLGGPDAPKNLRAAHLACNVRKQGVLISDRYPEVRRGEQLGGSAAS